jgi:hypothetical protein
LNQRFDIGFCSRRITFPDAANLATAIDHQRQRNAAARSNGMHDGLKCLAVGIDVHGHRHVPLPQEGRGCFSHFVLRLAAAGAGDRQHLKAFVVAKFPYDLDDVRKLHLAWPAPCGPEIDEDDFIGKVVGGQRRRGRIECRNRDGRDGSSHRPMLFSRLSTVERPQDKQVHCQHRRKQREEDHVFGCGTVHEA